MSWFYQWHHRVAEPGGARSVGRWTRPGLAARGRRNHCQRPGHHANLLPWQRAARQNSAVLRLLRPTRRAACTWPTCRRCSPRTRVLALTASANATGERPPFEELLRMAAQAGALTVLDAAQAAAYAMPALAHIDCDFLAFSGH